MPKAMFAATPPRRISSSSARKESEILSSCSTTRESRKRPRKVMRWSVAMDPVTAIFTPRNLPAETSPGHIGRISDRYDPDPVSRSAEAVTAGARAARVGVVDREALLLDRVGEVDRRAGQVGRAHPVDDDLDAAELGQQVAVQGALVEVQLVDQAGAAAGLDAEAQPQVVATLLLEQALDLAGGDVGEDDAVGVRALGGLVLNAHPSKSFGCAGEAGRNSLNRGAPGTVPGNRPSL